MFSLFYQLDMGKKSLCCSCLPYTDDMLLPDVEQAIVAVLTPLTLLQLRLRLASLCSEVTSTHALSTLIALDSAISSLVAIFHRHRNIFDTYPASPEWM